MAEKTVKKTSSGESTSKKSTSSKKPAEKKTAEKPKTSKASKADTSAKKKEAAQTIALETKNAVSKFVTISDVRAAISNISEIHMEPYDVIAGFGVRPGIYELNGATAIPTGVNFTISSNQAYSCELLLFKRESNTPFAVLPFPESYRIGNVWSMIVFDIDIEDFEYAYRFDGPFDEKKGLIFDKNKVILDPYAKAVTGQSVWGTHNPGMYKARVVKNNFDWGRLTRKHKAMEDLVIYEMHVRGFTKDRSSNMGDKAGTFAGIIEKLPYLKELGVNALELMPIFEFDETLDHRDFYGRELMDYWGYNTVSFFAPNTSYTSALEYNREGTELRELIKMCHENDIDVFLDVVFNHTAEGNEQGPVFSFKGIDNNIYYLLTPDGKYYNFSGCGNTLNCNHPIVQNFILDCLRYWVTNYHIDGFRFDLASILGRNEDGSPMSKPPLLQSLAYDPILGKVKLIAEAWDAGGLYQVGTFPSWNRWAEWNGRYRDDMRAFLKGDEGKACDAARRMMGSPDLYIPEVRGHNASVNFLNCHDGFTLHDMYTYNVKHNEENNWNNTDGANDNRSWNCGIEGETSDPEINKLRRRMVRNAAAVLMMSRGTPMFFMGDEFGNSQGGNNNAYCQDNNIAWLNWKDLDSNRDLYDFFKSLIRFRKEHDCIRKNCGNDAFGFPGMSVHDTDAYRCDLCDYSHYIGIRFAGYPGKFNKNYPQAVFIAVNAYWEDLDATLPALPEGSGYTWALVADTYLERPFDTARERCNGSFRINARSVRIYETTLSME
ncbi:MAG: glycogen debranching enzyme [Lachnospiraceae bacterium]|nr:glycogen debranching enzyme [Lachnospiraceae bacterium]